MLCFIWHFGGLCIIQISLSISFPLAWIRQVKSQHIDGITFIRVSSQFCTVTQCSRLLSQVNGDRDADEIFFDLSNVVDNAVFGGDSQEQAQTVSHGCTLQIISKLQAQQLILLISTKNLVWLCGIWQKGATLLWLAGPWCISSDCLPPSSSVPNTCDCTCSSLLSRQSRWTYRCQTQAD